MIFFHVIKNFNPSGRGAVGRLGIMDESPPKINKLKRYNIQLTKSIKLKEDYLRSLYRPETLSRQNARLNVV